MQCRACACDDAEVRVYVCMLEANHNLCAHVVEVTGQQGRHGLARCRGSTLHYSSPALCAGARVALGDAEGAPADADESAALAPKGFITCYVRQVCVASLLYVA